MRKLFQIVMEIHHYMWLVTKEEFYSSLFENESSEEIETVRAERPR
jgi:hypothetical protein